MTATLRSRSEGTLAVLLTGVAGWVDAIGYLVLYRVFTANMSGNTIAAGISLAEGDWGTIVRRGSVIPLFVLGQIASRFAVDLARRRNVRRIAAALFGVESLLLAVFALAGPGILAVKPRPGTAPFVFLVALAGIAMGLQNATLAKFGPLSVRTTHVTGTLAELSDHFAQAVLSWHDSGGRHLRAAAILASVWAAYAAGAGLGAAAELRWGVAALAVPIVLTAAVAIDDVREPLIRFETHERAN